MKIERLLVAYFSPVGKTAAVATIVGNYLGTKLELPVEYDDFTLPQDRNHIRVCGPKDLVVFLMPVYAGRIPNKMLSFVQNHYKGQNTWAVPIVTFGNRSFDNGLKELCFELDKNGFLTVGAAAVVVEHSFSRLLATERPDAADADALKSFAESVALKVQKNNKHSNETHLGEECRGYDLCPTDYSGTYLDIDAIPGEWPLEKYYTPLGTDGQPAMFLKAKPKTDEKACIACGLCAKVCPMGSIEQADISAVSGVCIKCQACIKKCPKQAKYFDDAAFLSHVKMLEMNYGRKAESQFFI